MDGNADAGPGKSNFVDVNDPNEGAEAESDHEVSEAEEPSASSSDEYTETASRRGRHASPLLLCPSQKRIKILSVRQSNTAAIALKEQTKVEETAETLEAFAASPDKLTNLSDFEKMATATRFA
ncbi:hypothetical protein BC834DRAFT_842463 [Gloeopeniophorella convolvens]|nr:hypothetical protein BC834DRAFT_842463 [Gloeopeniophorella convolvens]